MLWIGPASHALHMTTQPVPPDVPVARDVPGGATYPVTGAGPYGPETRWHPLPPATDYRMRRSATDKMIAGVCGGIAEHTDIDPVYIRLAFLVSLFWGGFGFFAYVAAAILLPKPLPTGS